MARQISSEELARFSQVAQELDPGFPRDKNREFLAALVRRLFLDTSEIFGASAYLSIIGAAGIQRGPSSPTVQTAIKDFRTAMRNLLHADIPLAKEIPEAARNTFGSALSNIWPLLQQEARLEFEELRKAEEKKTQEARVAQQEAESRLSQAEQVTERYRHENASMLERIGNLNEQLESSRSLHRAVSDRLEEADKANHVLHQSLDLERTRIDTQVGELNKAIERAEGGERRALMDIEKARAEASEVRHELHKAQATVKQAQDEIRELQEQLRGETGRRAAVEATVITYEKEILRLQQALAVQRKSPATARLRSHRKSLR